MDGPFPGTACPSGSSCLKQSNWYYQCLPTDGYTCYPATGSPGGGSGGSGSGSGSPSAAQSSLKMWDQCGGQGGNCNSYQCVDGAFANYACPSGASCQRQNQWYHQCLPGSNGGNGGNGGSGGSGGNGGPSTTLNIWEQCGGKGGNCNTFACIDSLYPGQSCAAGTSCQRLSEWYSQCRPSGSSYGSCEQVGACWGLHECVGGVERVDLSYAPPTQAGQMHTHGLAA